MKENLETYDDYVKRVRDELKQQEYEDRWLSIENYDQSIKDLERQGFDVKRVGDIFDDDILERKPPQKVLVLIKKKSNKY